ncbi:MAG: ketoacyl reductase, partial [Alphaproteobacteria bacterium]|nr:ketoacyl reductase [Alphaproteobacteria bacterium]
MDLGIAGRTAVVTGGADGNGFAAAEAFGRVGVRVVLVDIDWQATEAQASKLAARATS